MIDRSSVQYKVQDQFAKYHVCLLQSVVLQIDSSGPWCSSSCCENTYFICKGGLYIFVVAFHRMSLTCYDSVASTCSPFQRITVAS